MKTKALSILILVAALPIAAQQFSSGDVISRSPASSSQSGSGQTAITNSTGETYSLDRITTQLRELHRVVQETVPMLNAVSETQSNSVASGQSSSGGIAGILGSILNRNTNQPPASGSEQTTNSVLGGIIRGVLGNSGVASTSTNTATMNDLATLRDQLESIRPILERLVPETSNSSDQIARPSGGSRTNNLAPTGR